MLSDSSFVSQSLNSNLYFLRTIREFSTNIQLSFLSNNNEYIETARDFSDRCEELIGILMKYAKGRVSKEALNNQIFATNYTLDTELLTERLFGIDIDTSITEQQLNLIPGVDNNPSGDVINELTEVNQSSLVLVTNFISFCQNIISRMSNNDLFSYSYISLIDAMLAEANLYKLNLERIIARDTINPTFIVDYQYLFNSLLQKYSAFIRGLVDPKNAEIIVRAISFSNEFAFLASEYKTAISSPEVEEELNNRSLEAVDRFKIFLSNIIQDLLDTEAYFIVEPIFLDNILTSANYFSYTLKNLI